MKLTRTIIDNIYPNFISSVCLIILYLWLYMMSILNFISWEIFVNNVSSNVFVRFLLFPCLACKLDEKVSFYLVGGMYKYFILTFIEIEAGKFYLWKILLVKELWKYVFIYIIVLFWINWVFLGIFPCFCRIILVIMFFILFRYRWCVLTIIFINNIRFLYIFIWEHFVFWIIC